jgi:hypothetical protein
MRTRLNIDYPGGTVQLDSDHATALRDVLRLLDRIKNAEDRTVALVDGDGRRHHVNLAHVDRVDLSWEPSADPVLAGQPA